MGSDPVYHDSSNASAYNSPVMKKYSVILRGEGFELIMEGQQGQFGFHTTRVVKAETEEEAEEKAVALVKVDKKLVACMKPGTDTDIDTDIDNDPMIYRESITRVPCWRRVGSNGYSFWLM